MGHHFYLYRIIAILVHWGKYTIEISLQKIFIWQCSNKPFQQVKPQQHASIKS